MNRHHLRLNYREIHVAKSGFGLRRYNHGLRDVRRGFSLIELLIAMAVGMVVLGAMYSTFTIQNKTFTNQEEIVAMQQSVRAGMDMMAREIGMAGYDPARVNCSKCSPPTYIFFGVTVNTAQLQIQADLDGDGAIDATSQENIIYALASDATTANPNNKKITRKISEAAGAQPFVENVNVNGFTFEYLKSDGTTIDPAAPTASAEVREIRITITGRTAKPDPAYSANGGYRTYTLTSVIAPRNLAY